MIEIIRKREHIEETEYSIFFQRRKDSHGSGYSFDCDEQGNLLNSENQDRVNELKSDPDYESPELRAYVHRWTEPEIGRCHCGREVSLDGFTNTCRCGRDYNSAGQELAPRCQWGEETGETAADILNIG